ncbi:MucB/RseB C-terminal domain-containing protein [Entomomonas asaccharolytica]|uniref:MucB/RseB C-terminal domain-containing protein n=1 Tax=Entomomonas asaccharolytica TaxID=2785331 RepID=A0A974RW61_9GAMM|nr:MucB/RseB C-terminal domain-containing protein [Entomomonas asaccharolytica]QQP84891.1 MucB/RseB C-terminal domain-containing protein [Entomomonas asaccharolytica]
MKLLNKSLRCFSTVILLRLGAIVYFLLFSLSALAIQQDAVDAKTYLEHIIDAETSQSFKGVFSYNRPSYNVEIYIHQQVSEDGQVTQWVKKVDSNEGFLRLNGQVKCVTKGYKSRFRVNILQSITKSEIDNLLEDYTVTVSPADLMIGGRVAHELIFRAKEGDRYIYKLAFDKQTSFPLQFVFLDTNNNILESGQFSQFTPFPREDITATPLDDCVNVTYKELKDNKSPWIIGWKPKGFGLERAISKANSKDDHFVYSDGLVTFSVFIEPVTDPRMAEIERHFGAMIVVSRKVTVKRDNKQYLITVVGEIPLSTAERIALSVHQ